ncbi:MAG: oligosaccharide flippase family protein [Candidatus Omnitrophota bacterium]
MERREIASQLRGLTKDASLYNAGGILTKAIAFLLIPVYTRFLSPADYGIISLVSTIAYVLLIFYEMGLITAATRFYYDFKSEQEKKEYFGTVLLFLCGFTLIITIVLENIARKISPFLFSDVAFNPYIRIAIWIPFFQSLPPLVYALYRVKEQPYRFVIFSIFAFIIEIGLIIYFVVFLKQEALGKINATLIASGLIYIISLIILFNHTILKFSYSKIWNSLKFGLPLIPHTVAHWVLKLSDRIILQKYAPLSDVGLYTLGYNLGMILFLFTASFNNAWAPFLYKNANIMPKQVFAKIGIAYCFIVVFIGLLLSIFAKEIMIIVSTPKFYGAATVIPLVVAGYVFQGLYLLPVNQLFFLKQTRYLPTATMVSALINIILNLLFIPKFGMSAAAFNTFLSYLILFILVFFYSQRHFPISYDYRKFAIILLIGIFSYFLAINSIVLFKNNFSIVTCKIFVLSLFIISGYFLFKKDINLLKNNVFVKEK